VLWRGTDFKDPQTDATNNEFLRTFYALFYCRPLATHPVAMPNAKPNAAVEMPPDAGITDVLVEAMKQRLPSGLPVLFIPLQALRAMYIYLNKVFKAGKVEVADESGRVVCPIGEFATVFFHGDEVKDPALRAKLVSLLRVTPNIQGVTVKCTADFGKKGAGQPLDLQPLTAGMFSEPL
jgi:hypothetical protein